MNRDYEIANNNDGSSSRNSSERRSQSTKPAEYVSS